MNIDETKVFKIIHEKEVYEARIIMDQQSRTKLMF